MITLKQHFTIVIFRAVQFHDDVPTSEQNIEIHLTNGSTNLFIFYYIYLHLRTMPEEIKS